MNKIFQFSGLIVIALMLGISAFASAQKIDTLSYDYHTIEDSVAAFKTGSSHYANIMCTFPIFKNDKTEGKWMNDRLKKVLDVPQNVSFENGIKVNQKKYLKDYVDEMKSNEGGDSPTFDYMNSTEINVNYNKKGFIILALESSDYSGGAHGKYGVSYLAYDLQQQKNLELKDIVTADSVTLQHIVERQFRKDYELAETDSLNNILFENHLTANENFYFNNDGIGFSYNPYEVAAYANGIIDVFIPYNEIKKYLTASFKKQMQIK